MTDANPWDDDSDHEDEQTPPAETKNFAELRKAYNRRDKEAKAFEAELAELREFRSQVVAERTTAAITTAFKEAEVDPVHVDYFKAVNPDVEIDKITADQVREFAAARSLLTVSGDPATPPEPKDEGYKPVTTGVQAPPGMLTSEDVMKLLANGDTAAVNKAYADGRVLKETL